MPRKTGGHKDRSHAQWSASSTERNWLCPGNIALALDVVKPPENKAAAWGTACHEVSEHFLRHDQWPPSTTKIETERYTFYPDEEMIAVASAYVGYILERKKDGFDLYAVEQKFSLNSLNLGMDSGGTADAILYNPWLEELEIVDLKTGRGGLVEAKGNPQERFYALGALLTMDLDLTPVSTVRTTIVQPRYPHRDGIIRSEVIPLAELMDWTIDLDPRIRTAAAALKLYEQARDNSVAMDAWVETYLNPGETQCVYCPAAGACPALRRNAMAIAGMWQDDSGVHLKSNQFRENDVQGVEADLDMLDTLEAWIRERRALAHEMAVQGYVFDHHTLVEKVGHRKYMLPDNEMIDAIRSAMPISDDQLFDKKLKSPAGLERALGKQTVAVILGDLIHRPVIGTDLIRSTTVQRSVAPTLIDKFFIDMEVSENGPGQ